MDSTMIIIGLASVFATAAPVIFAVMGETISERAGVINLSMNGTILLSAMGGFAVAVRTESLLLGFLMGMLIANRIFHEVWFVFLDQSACAHRVGIVETLVEIDAPIAIRAHTLTDLLTVLGDLANALMRIEHLTNSRVSRSHSKRSITGLHGCSRSFF